MLTKRIIACLDVRGGRVVKGIQFVDIVDAGDPAELAHRHAAAGADEIVLLDITATHEGRGTLLDTVKRAAANLFVPFTVGGGIRSAEDAAAVFDAGADKVSINSSAIARPELIGEIGSSFGAQAVIVAIDARRKAESADPLGEAEVYVSGGRKRGFPTGMTTRTLENSTYQSFPRRLFEDSGQFPVDKPSVPVFASKGAEAPEFMPTKPCTEETGKARHGMPQVYYPLHSLLHTLRALETHQDQICTLLADIQRSGKVNAGLRKELTALLNQLPSVSLDAELHAVWSALEAA